MWLGLAVAVAIVSGQKNELGVDSFDVEPFTGNIFLSASHSACCVLHDVPHVMVDSHEAFVVHDGPQTLKCTRTSTS